MNEQNSDVTSRERIISIKTLTIKENWNLDNASAIALLFGYVCDANFVHALSLYIKQVVDLAALPNFLVPSAEGFFIRLRNKGVLQKIIKPEIEY